MKIDKDNIAVAWTKAADELALRITIPFIIRLEDGRKFEFIGLIEDFGSPKGTLICLPIEWDDESFRDLAKLHGYYCSGLYSSYETYDKGLFVETLIDWGWYGEKGKHPVWYNAPPAPARS